MFLSWQYRNVYITITIIIIIIIIIIINCFVISQAKNKDLPSLVQSRVNASISK